MRVRVDEQLCQGHTRCQVHAPAIFLPRDEDGHARVETEDVPPASEESVLRAAEACPEGAIVISEDGRL